MPAYQNCGSPGEKRPFGEAKKGQNILRKKAGRKTIKERLVPGFVSPQAGMSAANTKLFISLYKQLKTPTLTDVKVYRKIITNVFVKNYEISKNGLVPVMPEIGSYPNYRQFQHLINSMNKIDKLLLDTTKGHFNRNHRGLTSKSWMNVAGPGHVFAIDSTIADIYLRSSANRAWVCGRPIVYIVVDVWSSAIVGFYVCWTGPAWNMAKVALFCTVAPKDMVANLWGIEEKILLSPEPTLPYSFRTDRGE